MIKGKLFYKVLFFLTISSLMMILVQTVWRPVNQKPLKGVTDPVEFPTMTFDSLYDGSYQRQLDAYLSQNYGFRESSIRLYNQYIWSFYGKENVDHIVSGKEGWLFYNHHVDDYYGQEMYRWHQDKETAVKTYELELKRMMQLRKVLKRYGVEFLMFVAPDKAFVYPDYLPEQEHDTTTINARKYYTKRFEEVGFPYIDMTEMFLEMKDTMSYPIMPSKGAHWNNSCVYGIDTLLHLMGELKGEQLADFSYGDAIPSYRFMEVENDIETYINLLIENEKTKKFQTKERQYKIVADSNTLKPNVLFVGNSFLFQIYDYIHLDSIFSDISHWYYNRMSYKGFNRKHCEFSEIDRLQTMLLADYVIWFADGAQLYKTSYGFAEDALIKLYVDDDRFWKVWTAVRDSMSKEIMSQMPKDSVFDTTLFLKQIGDQAYTLVTETPEMYFEEIRKDSIPQEMDERNEKILLGKQIIRDEKWYDKIKHYSNLMSMSEDEALNQEIDNIYNNRPLLRDKDVNLTDKEREERLNAIIEEIKSKPEMMEDIKKKAAKKNISVEQAIIDDANWILEYKLKNFE